MKKQAFTKLTPTLFAFTQKRIKPSGLHQRGEVDGSDLHEEKLMAHAFTSQKGGKDEEKLMAQAFINPTPTLKDEEKLMAPDEVEADEVLGYIPMDGV